MTESVKQTIFHIRPIAGLGFAALLLTVRLSLSAEVTSNPQSAERAFQEGRFDHALTLWEKMLPELTQGERIDALLGMAAAYHGQGRLQEAFSSSQQAAALAEASQDAFRRSLGLSSLSDAYLLSRQLQNAERLALESVAVASESTLPLARATTLNQLGNVLMAKGSYGKALDVYDEALGFAKRATEPALVVKVLINALHGLLAADKADEALPRLKTAMAQARLQPDSGDNLLNLIALGHLAQRLAPANPAAGDTLLQLGYTAFSDALVLAESMGSLRGKSYAIGHLGEPYASEGRFDEAQRLYLQALFYAEETDAPELSARWQWRLGRLRKAQNRPQEAIAAYRHALDHLQLIQPALVFGHRGYPTAFRDNIGQIYRELATLLLARANSAKDAVQQQQALRKIRDVMEDFKAVELKNYFRDQCVTELQQKNRALDLDSLIKPGTATLYPVVFDDRTVLLLSLASGDIRFDTVPVKEADLRRAADALRRQMHPAGNPRRLLKNAQRLYQWLIEPLATVLASEPINTLVVVPDGVLRTIPFAALHDGEGYLVQRYALVITPGLMLTHATDSTAAEPRVLANGLSVGVQGFDALPHVSAEVAGISSTFQGKQLVNEGFLKTNVISELQRTPYSIVSFSTHGFFDSNPEESFLLTYDNRLTLDELEQFIRISEFREKPVEMIVLSACDTAVGDERAALGLAGIALKAGARSAMASLWSVNDESTAALVPQFFKHLKNPQFSKAQALQRAQLGLLSNSRTSHPYYWAPFVLIGNWF